MDNAQISKIYVPIVADNCSCNHCDMFRPLYNVIKGDNPRWLTISPRVDDRDPNKYLNLWYEEFMHLRKFSNRVLGVVEFANLRMHFHILYSVTDRIKEYRTINKWRTDNQVKVYDGVPREGLHYLFKDTENTTQLINTSKYIITMDTIEQEMINRGLNLRKRKADPLDGEAYGATKER